jgi:signal transduction histidine kinase
LFIAKTIVEAHGGRIWVEIAPSSNTVLFTFSLPVNHS